MKVTMITLMIPRMKLQLLMMMMITFTMMVITKENVSDSPSVAVVLAVLLLGVVRRRDIFLRVYFAQVNTVVLCI